MGTFVRTINASAALSLPIAVRMPATVVRVSVEKMPVLGAKLMPIVLRATSVLKGHAMRAEMMQIAKTVSAQKAPALHAELTWTAWRDSVALKTRALILTAAKPVKMPFHMKSGRLFGVLMPSTQTTTLASVFSVMVDATLSIPSMPLPMALYARPPGVQDSIRPFSRELATARPILLVRVTMTIKPS
jgi:hypothetical protein